MALVLADRVRDTTTTTGTGTVTLSGTAPTGYQTFGAAIGNGNTTYYTINAGSQWEVGLGTYSSTGPTLARTTVLASSNGGSLVDFSTGTKDVFVTYPAEEAVYQDGSAIKAGTAILGVTNGGTGTNTTFTAGSVVFAGASGVYSQDNANLFWDNSNDRLGISTTSPGSKLDVRGVITGGDGTIQTVISYLASAGVTGTLTNHPYVFYANNAERARIDTSGNFGIGTSSPGNKLSVNGDASFGDSIFMGTGVSTGDCKIELGSNRSAAGNAYIDFHALAGQDYNGRLIRTSGANGSFEITNAGTGAMTFSTNNGERMRIDGSNGNVGIGTAPLGFTPLYIYRSGSDAGLRAERASGAALDMFATASTAYFGTANSYPLILQTNGSEKVRIDTSGNVGIGTSSPSSRLTITGGNTEIRDGNYLLLRPSGNAWDMRLQATGTQLDILSGGALGSPIMSLLNGGNVGIGTSAPAVRLDVTGPVETTFSPNVFNTALFGTSSATSGNAGSGISFKGYTTGTSSISDLAFVSGIKENTTDGNYSGALVFGTRTNGSGGGSFERMRITSSGFLLVGTTAPLGGNTSSEFKVTGAGSWPLTLNANDRGLLVRNSAAGSGFYAYFEYNGGTNNGSISWSGGTTSYTTTSDARVKKNIVDAPDAGALIDAIKVRSWDFKVDDMHWRYGMVAQELLEVAPEAVTVPEDEEKMMGIDYAKLVPMLIKEVQSLRARVAQLEGN